jgi:ParB family chromosome partitioning protein
MTAQAISTVQRGVELVIPLSKLKKSPKNARRTPHATADIEALAASISVKGVLQPPVVAAERTAEGGETGCYLVTIGEGRRLALKLLAKRKVIGKAEPVRCLLDEENDAFEVSLDENVTRLAMHPADQFEAFRDLAEINGWSAEEIAARFGVTAQVVRQRLRLGSVSPKLIAAYRAEHLSLDQLMAFAITEDHARQELAYESLSYNKSPQLIRRLLTDAEVEASDRRARFVGAAAYEAEGGRIRRDLFADDQGGWFEDVGFLERLALERLAVEAERVRTEEGWQWGEAHLDYPQGHGLRRIYPKEPVLDEAERERLSALAEEYDRLIAEGGDEGLADGAEARLAAIDSELQAASGPVYDPDWIARAGVFVVLDWNGEARIERGFVRAQDEAPVPEVEGPTNPGESLTGTAASVGETASKPLSDRLVADLTAHRTAALRDVLARNPDAAFLAALHALVLDAFYHGRAGSCLELKATETPLASHADSYADSLAARSIEARHAGWAAKLPEGAADAWTTLDGFVEADRRALFAHCVSLSVNALWLYGGRAAALAHADVLADFVDLDMTRYWQATADGYFLRVSKPQILEAVREAKSPDAASRIEGLKKEAMAKAAVDLLGGDGWLPAILRSSKQAGDPDQATA